ncbi:gluconate 2-dehydrogenase subunit 3 family protein [Novosphingobium rosa]|uniref:gluconate 2-dehydrogenase subunit 3 family protein n=1 Tax=Novosphingobium rosa TaxID=76978 RepID=UPI00082FB860|nr:gluconate 2-dehydrogenase subunit 3 family protein [Novosphingobium rosa]
MADHDPSLWKRRDVLGGAALFALAVGLPVAAIRLTDLSPDDRPTPRLRRMLREVSQLVIPRSDTPGAGDAGVGDFLIFALAHGMEGTGEPFSHPGTDLPLRANGSLRHTHWLETELDRRGNGDWLALSPTRRAEMLAALDHQAFPDGPPPAVLSPWRAIKGLILTGYYTSQIGGAQELRYALIPGRYDADLPFSSHDRAWSSDWTAVDFG